jgi:hypothetical protein
MRTWILRTISVIAVYSAGCSPDSPGALHHPQLKEINFQKNEVHMVCISEPVIVEIFADSLDYDRFEEANAKQEYYNLVDFQGYYYHKVKPVTDLSEIRSVPFDNANPVCFEINNGTRFSVNTASLPYKQGVLLFDGKSQPVFWQGDRSGELESFIQSFFGVQH